MPDVPENSNSYSAGDAAKQHLELLHPRPGQVFELRAQVSPSKGRPYIASGYFNDPVEAAKAATHYSLTRGVPAVYATLNEINPALFARAPNLMIDYAKQTTSDTDVVRRRWIPIDIDPNRPSGVAATDIEQQTAVRLAADIESVLGQRGFPLPLNLSSGNGCVLLYRVDLPNDDETKALIRGFYVGLNSLLGTYDPSQRHSKIDLSVYSAAQLIRVAGTINRKGFPIDDRPYRYVALKALPATIEVVPVDLIRSVAALAPSKSGDAGRSSQPGVAASDNGSPRRSRLDVETWLQDRGQEFSKKILDDGRTAYLLRECPFDHSHGAKNEVAIFQAPIGRMGAKCLHNSCEGRGWHDFKRAIGPPERQHYNGQAPPANAPDQGESASLEPGSIVGAKDRDNFGTVVADHGDTVEVHFVSPEGQQVTKSFAKSELVDPNSRSPAGSPLRDLTVIDSKALDEADYAQRFLVKNILVADQPAIVGGRSKTLKTTLLIDLALPLGTGTDFLGHFPATRAKVALLSGESGDFTIQETARRIAKAKKIELRDADVMWGFKLPHITSDGDLAALGEMILANNIEVIIIDPAYLCMMAGDSRGLNASNLFDIGPLLLRLAEVGHQTNSTVILCHHCRKNSPNEKFAPPDLEELAMAGFAEFARQWLLLGRREEYKNDGEHQLWLTTGGSAGHSGLWALDVHEGQLAEDFSGRKWEVEVSTVGDVKRERQEAKMREKAKAQEAKEIEYRRRLLDTLCRFKEGETAGVLKSTSGLNNDNYATAIRTLMKEGRAVSCRVKKSNGHSYDGMKYVER